MATEDKNPRFGDHRLKTLDFMFEAKIEGNATPASKKHSSDLSGIVYLRTEGKVSEADAIEDLSSDFTTADDNDGAGNSQFGILIKGDEISRGLEKVYEVEVVDQDSLASSLTVAPAQSDYLTSDGNIAIDITGTGLDLETESPTLLVKVKCLKDI